MQWKPIEDVPAKYKNGDESIIVGWAGNRKIEFASWGSVLSRGIIREGWIYRKNMFRELQLDHQPTHFLDGIIGPVDIDPIKRPARRVSWLKTALEWLTRMLRWPGK